MANFYSIMQICVALNSQRVNKYSSHLVTLLTSCPIPFNFVPIHVYKEYFMFQLHPSSSPCTSGTPSTPHSTSSGKRKRLEGRTVSKILPETTTEFAPSSQSGQQMSSRWRPTISWRRLSLARLQFSLDQLPSLACFWCKKIAILTFILPCRPDVGIK